MNVDFKTISDTRKQLHWASQLLSAAADATLTKMDDDSHSNLGWDPDKGHLVGRSNCSIDVVRFALIHDQKEFSFGGQTLAASKQWLSDSLDVDLTFRDYDMPSHAVAEGAAFNAEPPVLEAIAQWFTLAQRTLTPHGSVRVWPHHFDMGFWNPGTSEGKSIGGGFSLGDQHFEQPYFYINPYGVERPDALPDLSPGHWTEHWVGAVLTAEAMEVGTDPQGIASTFVDSAMKVAEQLTS